MKFISENKITIIFFFIVVILASVLVISYNNTQKLKSINDLVGHTQEVLHQSDNVLLDILSIETGSRGYVLSGNQMFLEPYNNSIATIHNNLATLAKLTKDNPKQQLRIDSLRKVIDDRLFFAKNSIEEKKKNIEVNELGEIISNRMGKMLTDKIRRLITGINLEEFSLLKKRKVENEENTKFSESMFLLLLVFITVICALVIILIKNQKVKDKIAEQLNKSILVAELATEKANESNKLKEAFLANMSHEIRTPMNAIIGFSDLLFKRKLEEKEKEYVAIIKSAGENLLTIINDILDISKIEAGMMTFEEHTFSVKQIFKSLSVMMMVRAKEKGLELVFSCDEDVPDILLGDNTRLTQIIINLAGNAIKFTQKGKVTVHAKTLNDDTKNSSIEFSIKDTGIGIAPDKLEHIFERFHQAESNTTRKYGGTGLGLSIAKKLVELQGGTLSVKSQLNVGSEFSFCISYKKASDVHEESEKAEEEKKYNMEELSKLNILLVEDNQLNIKLILSLFSENNLKVQVAENGSEGIKKLKENKFDIILMDMEMPVMNGYEATVHIRKELKNNIPIIAMTAHAMAGEKERCLGLGMNDYLSKPINANMLFTKIYSLTVKP